MNTTDSILRHRSNRVFTTEAVRCLRRIVTQTDCSIVVSSSWREPDQFKILPEVFRCNGLPDVLRCIIGTTPILPKEDGVTREDEIDCWLATEGHLGAYAILDDTAPSGTHRAHWVRTSIEIGLTEAECKVAIGFLKHKRAVT